MFFFFFSSRRRHTRFDCDWSSDVCSSDLEDHPDTLTTRGTLAWTAELQRRYAEAEQQYRSLLADRERVLGAGHPDTLIARQDVARLARPHCPLAAAQQPRRPGPARPAARP